MPVTYFDLRTYEKYVNNTDKEDDTKLIGLYKILSPAHLLKQPFINDSNSNIYKGFCNRFLFPICQPNTAANGQYLVNSTFTNKEFF